MIILNGFLNDYLHRCNLFLFSCLCKPCLVQMDSYLLKKYEYVNNLNEY